eukprot:13382278-Alexandrium_andersonii.AAC.1
MRRKAVIDSPSAAAEHRSAQSGGVRLRCPRWARPRASAGYAAKTPAEAPVSSIAVADGGH